MRALIAAAAAASLAFAAQGNAAVAKPQIVDATGDAVPPISAGYDIVSALFKTEGTTAKVGRKTVYTPTKLVVAITYAGVVPTEEVAAQVVMFDVPGCSNVYLERFAVGETYGNADCLDTEFDFTAKVTGNTLTFTVPFTLVGKNYLKKGAALTELRTYTALADPDVGYETGELAGILGVPGTIDDATTDVAYRIG